MTFAQWMLATLATLSLVAVLGGHWQLVRMLAKKRALPPPPTLPPSVTLIRPIRGLDVGARENVLSLLELDYPGELELLFIFDGEEDPACALVRQLLATHPRGARASVLIAGQPPRGRTGKLNAMVVGVQRARGELVAFSDSDTRPESGVLSALVGALVADRAAGASFAPIYAEADAPLSGDVGYGLLVNAWYGPSVVRASGEDGSMPFIMGQLMVMRREALTAIGGIGCAEGQFVDDMYIGMQVAKAGWKNLVVNVPLRVVTGGMGMGAFLKTFRRWVLFSESGLTFDFARPNYVRVISSWMAWMALIASLAIHSWGVFLLAALVIAASAWSQVRLQRACHGPRIRLRHLWVPVVLPLLSAVVALAARLSRRVDWRGRSYVLDAGARLRSADSPLGSV